MAIVLGFSLITITIKLYQIAKIAPYEKMHPTVYKRTCACTNRYTTGLNSPIHRRKQLYGCPPLSPSGWTAPILVYSVSQPWSPLIPTQSSSLEDERQYWGQEDKKEWWGAEGVVLFIGGCRNSKWPGPDFSHWLYSRGAWLIAVFFRLFRADEKILGLWTRLDS